MRKYILLFVLIVGVCIGQLHPGIVKADIGPTSTPPQGGTLQPAATTNVAMDDEKVTLTYGQPRTISDPLANSSKYMDVHVNAVFTMNNTGAAETIKVYFPASDADFVNGYSEDKITNFTVNGAPLTGLVDVPAGFGKEGTTIKAYQWQQAFPSGTSTLTVSYDSRSDYKYGYFYLTYVLGTGRNWAGTIKTGEVNFVLPSSVPAYAVTSKPPILKASSLPYTLSGNTIKVSFTNYEPAADAAIDLGVNDLTTIAKVEAQAAQKTQTLETYLTMANDLWVISQGPHCLMCTDVASQAEKYYGLALDKATSQADVERVLMAYSWGANPPALTLAKLYGIFTTFAQHQDCDNTGASCDDWETLQRSTPFGFNASTKVVTHADFLALYACRLRPFDAANSAVVETYAGKKLATCPVKTVSATTTTPTTGNVQATKTAAKKPWLLPSIIAGGIVAFIALITLVVIIIKRRKAHRPN
ncbi:MAG TPA: hypothetical protein VIR03_00625 [Candidatus Saccharimonadales bacterium]